MKDIELLVFVLFIAIGVFTFLMLLAGARRAVIEKADEDRKGREAAERARMEALAAESAGVTEVKGVE